MSMLHPKLLLKSVRDGGGQCGLAQSGKCPDKIREVAGQ